MPEEVDEPITVAFSPEGEPRSFVWRRFEYFVTGVPQAFFRRRNWWKDRQPLTRIDQELWRVEASSSGASTDAHLYDLIRQTEVEEWRLALNWE